jgi:hypothetical protein
MKTRRSNDAALLIVTYLTYMNPEIGLTIYKSLIHMSSEQGVLPSRKQIGQFVQGQNHGRTIAQSLSRPSVTAESLFRFQAKVAVRISVFLPMKCHTINALCSIRLLSLSS